MTGAWNTTAKALVVTTVVCAGGFMCAGLFSARHPVIMSLAFGMCAFMCASILGAIGLAAYYYVKLRRHLRTYLDRLPLSDEEFAALLPDDVSVDLDVVREVRQMAARRFWLIGGDCFYPGDRLEEDLHLLDVAFFALENFGIDLEEYLDGTEGNAAEGEIVTFGDVVLLADRLRRGRNNTA